MDAYTEGEYYILDVLHYCSIFLEKKLLPAACARVVQKRCGIVYCMYMTTLRTMICAVAGCIGASVLTGCGGSESTSPAAVPADTSASDTMTPAAVEIQRNDRLAVDPAKCIGCGKCTRTAPQNFSMDTATRKAVVISTEVTSPAAVDRAVQGCPARAIIQ